MSKHRDSLYCKNHTQKRRHAQEEVSPKPRLTEQSIEERVKRKIERECVRGGGRGCGMQKGWGARACYLREGCGGLARSLLGGRLLGHDLLDDGGTHRLSARAGTIATASLHRQPASTHRSQHIDTDYYSTPAKLLQHRISLAT